MRHVDIRIGSLFYDPRKGKSLMKLVSVIRHYEQFSCQKSPLLRHTLIFEDENGDEVRKANNPHTSVFKRVDPLDGCLFWVREDLANKRIKTANRTAYNRLPPFYLGCFPPIEQAKYEQMPITEAAFNHLSELGPRAGIDAVLEARYNGKLVRAMTNRYTFVAFDSSVARVGALT